MKERASATVCQRGAHASVAMLVGLVSVLLALTAGCSDGQSERADAEYHRKVLALVEEADKSSGSSQLTRSLQALNPPEQHTETHRRLCEKFLFLEVGVMGFNGPDRDQAAALWRDTMRSIRELLDEQSREDGKASSSSEGSVPDWNEGVSRA